MRRILPIAILLSLLPAAFAKPVNFYSIERELALGRQLAMEVEKQAKLVDDPLVSEYVNRLGQNLARHSGVLFPVSFTLIESDEINAFTLPGGHVYINTGLLRLSDNEAELASVIAHELAHAAARHATRQATREQIAGAAMAPLGLLGAWGSLASLASPLAFFHFSRVFETEADEMGLRYLADTGYDPNASIDMFERIEATERKQPGSVSKLFRTHPLTPDRIAKAQQNIEKVGKLLGPRSEYVLNTSDYEEARERLKSLTQARKPESNDRPTLRRPSEASK